MTINAAVVVFLSANPEPQEFPILDVNPERANDRRLIYRVPANLAPLFRQHFHVVAGRVREVANPESLTANTAASTMAAPVEKKAKAEKKPPAEKKEGAKDGAKPATVSLSGHAGAGSDA